MDWLPLNLDIMKNPLNWLVVFFMVFLLLVPVALLHEKMHPTG